MLQGLRTLKVFGRDKVQEEKIYEVSEDYRKSTMEVLRVSFLSALALETAATISTAMIAVNLGLRLVYDKISFFNAFFILVLAPDFYIPLRQLGLKFHSSLNGQVAIEKIEALENNLEYEDYGKDIYPIDSLDAIEVRGLSYSHEEKEALQNISFTIRSGEKIALVGESGSGKSTLINIICRLLQVDSGMVFINGMDIKTINKKAYIEKLAVVPQYPHIFSRSLQENIMLKSNMGESTKFRKVCRQTRIDSFSGELSDTYNTLIGEGEKVEISGGESQRIALARAALKEADLIVMDEPTSALDPDTEEVIGELLKDTLKDKTVIISAHRLNTLKNADRILVLHKGSLVEEGTHDELLLNKGFYYSLLKEGGKLEHI
jgi:ATP-binding cassette subfamily C protein CydD